MCATRAPFSFNKNENASGNNFLYDETQALRCLSSLSLHTFSAFWLRSSVVSVLLSLISETWSISPAEWLGRFLKPIWLSRSVVFVFEQAFSCALACELQKALERDLGIAVYPLSVAGFLIFFHTIPCVHRRTIIPRSTPPLIFFLSFVYLSIFLFEHSFNFCLQRFIRAPHAHVDGHLKFVFVWHYQRCCYKKKASWKRSTQFLDCLFGAFQHGCLLNHPKYIWLLWQWSNTDTLTEVKVKNSHMI